MASCMAPTCDRPVDSKGMCLAHYKRWRKAGVVDLSPLRGESFEDRLWQGIEVGDCWLWTRAKTGGGYGNLFWHGKYRPVHRIVWELLVGPIPPELTLDHQCRVRHCANPDHMEVVTRGVNTLRGYSQRAIKYRENLMLHTEIKRRG